MLIAKKDREKRPISLRGRRKSRPTEREAKPRKEFAGSRGIHNTKSIHVTGGIGGGGVQLMGGGGDRPVLVAWRKAWDGTSPPCTKLKRTGGVTRILSIKKSRRSRGGCHKRMRTKKRKPGKRDTGKRKIGERIKKDGGPVKNKYSDRRRGEGDGGLRVPVAGKVF